MTEAEIHGIIYLVRAKCLSYEYSFWRMISGREDITASTTQRFKGVLYHAHIIIDLYNDPKVHDSIYELIAGLYGKGGHLEYAQEIIERIKSLVIKSRAQLKYNESCKDHSRHKSDIRNYDILALKLKTELLECANVKNFIPIKISQTTKLCSKT